MTKSFITASAVAVALAFSAVPMSLTAAQAVQPTVSKASAKTLAAANDAYKAKRCPEAISKAEEALRISEKTADDTYVAYSIMASCHQQMGNKAAMLKDFQGQLDSGFRGVDQNLILRNMYGTAFELKDYAQAVELGQRMIRTGVASADTHEQVAVAMQAQGKQADAIKFLSDHVADLEKRGQRPPEATLLRLRDMLDKAGNANGATTVVEKLVVNYPKPDYWRLLTHSLARDSSFNSRQKMNIYRLRFATGTLKLCQDYTEMAEFAVDSGLAGEGQKVIDQGLAVKACTAKMDQDRLERLRNQAVKYAAEERARLSKLESEAKAAPTGEPHVAVGYSLFGFGDYPKAAEWLSRGVTKGGLKDVTDAQIALGIAHLRAGNKAEALKTFNSIKAPDANSQRIVKFWTLYASSK